MLSALIVEDDVVTALALRDLVETDDRYHVAAMAEDMSGALAASRAHHVDLALVGLELARESSGYGVACELTRQGIRCLFVTKAAPPFPMPELAVGCLSTPCTAQSVQCALDAVAASLQPHDPQVTKVDAGFVLY